MDIHKYIKDFNKRMDQMNLTSVYCVTGKKNSKNYLAKTEGAARGKFHDEFSGESIISIKILGKLEWFDVNNDRRLKIISSYIIKQKLMLAKQIESMQESGWDWVDDPGYHTACGKIELINQLENIINAG
jgi:hypothetical protein